jgi:predicted RNase H-like HicB family nuclease
MRKYTFSVQWSDEDGEHVGLCAEFPSLSWLEQTPEAALAGIRKIVADTLAELIQSDEPLPEPRTLITRSGRPLIMPTEGEEAAIQRGIEQDPDNPELTAEEIKGMRPFRDWAAEHGISLSEIVIKPTAKPDEPKED